MKFLAIPLRILSLTVLLSGSFPPFAETVVAQESRPFAVEYYYKVRWGHFDEFLELYKRNHYPILLKLKELGRIVEMSAARPVNHAGEASRWDFRFTIVWKDAATAYSGFDESGIIRELYPDQDTFRREEQRRFQILEQHLDVPVFEYDLDSWPTAP